MTFAKKAMPSFIETIQLAAGLTVFAAIIVCLVNLVMTGRSGRVWLLLTFALVAKFLVIFRDVVEIWVGFGAYEDIFEEFGYFSVAFTFLFAVAAHQFISYKRDELLRSFGASQTVKRILESSLGAMGDGFDVVASDMRVIYSNPMMQAVSDGDALTIDQTTEEARISTQLVLATLRSGVPSRGEEVVKTEDGTVRVMDIVVSPITASDGQTLACVRVARDITEMKDMQKAVHGANILLEEKVKERTQRLEETLNQLSQTHEHLLQSEKLAALGKIASGLTHNITNPLSVLGPKLKLFGDYFWHVDGVLRDYRRLHELDDADLIKKALEETERKAQEGRGIDYYLRKLNRFVVPCVKEVHKIEKIVQDLADYSRMQKPEVEPVDMNEQLRLVTSLLEFEFKSHDIRLETRYEVGLPRVECYAADMNQVLTNLLVNGIEAVAVKKEREPRFSPVVKVATSSEEGKVLITVEDNGIGVSEEDALRIFDPFFTTKRVNEGVGLGLSVSAGIVEKHGGTIRLESDENKYSRFVIELPVLMREEVPAARG